MNVVFFFSYHQERIYALVDSTFRKNCSISQKDKKCIYPHFYCIYCFISWKCSLRFPSFFLKIFWNVYFWNRCTINENFHRAEKVEFFYEAAKLALYSSRICGLIINQLFLLYKIEAKYLSWNLLWSIILILTDYENLNTINSIHVNPMQELVFFAVQILLSNLQ